MQNIKVEINVSGSVSDSEIVGVRLENSQQPLVMRDRFFNRILFEYLTLPTFSELGARVDRFLAKRRKGGIPSFDFAANGLEYLWMSVLKENYWMAEPSNFMMFGPGGPQDLQYDSWLELKNVQITPFVNRSPGKFFRGGWEFTNGHGHQDSEKYLVNTSMWTWEDYAVRTMGIGDIRLGETMDSFHVMQLSAAHRSDPITEHLADGSRLRYGGATLSPLGFPILVDDLFYHRIRGLIENYGAAFIDSLFAQIHVVNDDRFLLWAKGVPKLCLVVTDRAAAANIGKPQTSYAALWTVATDAELTKFHYCTWGFELGVPGYKKYLEKSVRLVETAIQERGLRPLFEFDSEVNWFGDGTLFGPREIKELHRTTLKDKKLKERSELISYSTFYDNMVERETHLEHDVRDLICRGLALIDVEDYTASAECLNAALELAPGSGFTNFKLGVARFLAGDRQSAVELWQRSLALGVDYHTRDRIIAVLQNMGVTPVETDDN